MTPKENLAAIHLLNQAKTAQLLASNLRVIADLDGVGVDYFPFSILPEGIKFWYDVNLHIGYRYVLSINWDLS